MYDSVGLGEGDLCDGENELALRLDNCEFSSVDSDWDLKDGNLEAEDWLDQKPGVFLATKPFRCNDMLCSRDSDMSVWSRGDAALSISAESLPTDEVWSQFGETVADIEEERLELVIAGEVDRYDMDNMEEAAVIDELGVTFLGGNGKQVVFCLLKRFEEDGSVTLALA